MNKSSLEFSDENQDNINITEPISQAANIASGATFVRPIANAVGQIAQTFTAGINYWTEGRRLEGKKVDYFTEKLRKEGKIIEIEAEKELEDLQRKHEVLMLKKELAAIQKLQKKQHNHESKQAAKAFEYKKKLAKIGKEYLLEIKAFESQLRQNELEGQRKLELEIKQFERETQIFLAKTYFNTVFSSIEEQKFYEKYPLTTLPRQIFDFYKNYCTNGKPVPPLVIIPPLIIDSKQISGTNKVSKKISENLDIFLTQKYYSLNGDSPVLFLKEAWENPDIPTDTASRYLFDVYKQIPTLIVKTEFEDKGKGNMLTLKIEISWWNGIADWLPPSSHSISIENPESLSLSSYLSEIFYLTVGSIVDEYYLFHYQFLPRLPELLQELTANFSDRAKRELIYAIALTYEPILRRLANDRPTLSIYLAMELARKIADFPGQTVQSVARDLVSFSNKVFSDSLNMHLTK